MSGDVTNIADFKARKEEEDIPHITGPAKCTRCQHKWTSVTPVGKVQELECPNCHSETGALVHHCVWNDFIYVCKCGNDFMQATRHGVMCVNCGLHHAYTNIAEAFK